MFVVVIITEGFGNVNRKIFDRIGNAGAFLNFGVNHDIMIIGTRKKK